MGFMLGIVHGMLRLLALEYSDRLLMDSKIGHLDEMQTNDIEMLRLLASL
jgi:hypothetical protein